MFDFNNAETAKNNYKSTITPGVHTVKVASITSGINSNAKTPYLEITVQTPDGSAELNKRWTITTTITPGKQKSAWDVASGDLLSLVAASYSLDEVSAKAKMPQPKSVEELVSKMSAILVGKEFRLKVNGEEKISQKGTLYVASQFSNGVFCESLKTANTQLHFNAEKNIKRLPDDVKADALARQAAQADMQSGVSTPSKPQEGFSQAADSTIVF